MKVIVDLNDAYYAEVVIGRSGTVECVAMICVETAVARLCDVQEAVAMLTHWLDEADFKAIGIVQTKDRCDDVFG